MDAWARDSRPRKPSSAIRKLQENGGSPAAVRTHPANGAASADLSDTPRDAGRDEQYDNQRELPLATGVVEVGEFLEALAAIGYDGPVRAEPFNNRLNETVDHEAIRGPSDALRRSVSLVG